VGHPVPRRESVPPAKADDERSRPATVLFVCTGNSFRSPAAEALLRHRAAGLVSVTSAGSRPAPRMHPGVVRVLREEFAVDIAEQRPRHLDTLARSEFDHVITLCDKAREVCPDFGPRSRRAHWSIAEPAAASHDAADTNADPSADPASYAAFQRTAADVDTRVRHLLPVLADTVATTQNQEVGP
nr:arsenate reductase ArsC [Micromonospora sp. DSM 115978]